MVGHTGSIPAAIKAVEIVDKGVGEVVEATLAVGEPCSSRPITECGKMLDENGKPFTRAHTTYPIELIYVAAIPIGTRSGLEFWRTSLRRSSTC